MDLQELLKQGREALEIGDYSVALVRFKRVVEGAPDNVQAR